MKIEMKIKMTSWWHKNQRLVFLFLGLIILSVFFRPQFVWLLLGAGWSEICSALSALLKNTDHKTSMSIYPDATHAITLPTEESVLPTEKSAVPTDVSPLVQDNPLLQKTGTDRTLQIVAPPMISSDEWDSLLRNTKDGGANSVLAGHILRKSITQTAKGREQVAQMLLAAQSVNLSTIELKHLADDTVEVSQHAKFLAINLSIEAANMSGSGNVFGVLATEMGNLSARIVDLMEGMSSRVALVKERTGTNQSLCEVVGSLFINMDSELGQFNNVMLRIEELSIAQGIRLQNLEKKVNGNLKS